MNSFAVAGIVIASTLAYTFLAGVTWAIACRIAPPEPDDMIQYIAAALWPVAAVVWLVAKLLIWSYAAGSWLPRRRRRRATLPKATARRAP